MTATRAGVSTYRWSRVFVLRIAGLLTAGLGVVWVVLVVASLSLSWGADSMGLKACALLTMAVIIAIGVLLFHPPRVLELSPAGYRLRYLRGGGAPKANWSQVDSVLTREVPDGWAIVVQLSDGRTSTVPVMLLGTRSVEAQREMHERLNTAYGYRSLRETAS
jgi:hypothetical protein